MRSRTLANERTRPFYVRLKRPHLFGWYRLNLNGKRSKWNRLSLRQMQAELKIDQIAFFKKHFWYHFKGFAASGWIPVKHFRNNYCRLNVPVYKCSFKVNSRLAVVIMLCKYIKPDSNVKQIIDQYNLHSGNVLKVLVSQLKTFKNVSHKSMRRIRNQIRRQRPVAMTVKFTERVQDIMITGFNRRLFMYTAPRSGTTQTITRKRLLKAWRKCRYRSFSC